MNLKCIEFLDVIKSIIVNDYFIICVGLSLLSKTVDVTVHLVKDVYCGFMYKGDNKGF